jgi:TonB family protein
MSEGPSRNATDQDSTDILLWLGGLVVAGVAVSWLVVSQPWRTLSSPEPAAEQAPAAEPRAPERTGEAEPAADAAPAQPELGSMLDDPLRMARLAVDAGMLVEPEQYSAWYLYEQALGAEPDNPEALRGLRGVADALVRRGLVALEQGREDDVREILDRVLGTLPNHSGANRLAAELGEPEPEPEATPVVAAAPVTPVPVATQPETPRAAAVSPQPTPQVPRVDPLTQMRTAFDAAMAENRLLTPPENNARHFVELMSGMNGEAATVLEARQLLFAELLGRAAESTEMLDAQAAETWISEAAALQPDADAVGAARTALTARLVRAESLRPIPASELMIEDYVAPRYPNRAAARNLGGWVDVEFVVGTDGAPRDIVVADASHDTYFRDEAVAAIERWRFQPRVFLDQVIEQRAYTRIRFEFQ